MSWALVIAIGSWISTIALLACCLIARVVLARREAALSQRLTTLERDLKAMCNAQSKMGDELLSVEDRTRQLAQTQERLQMVSPENHHYRQAIALVSRGAETEELMASCGLARSEAELVRLLHGASTDPGPSLSVSADEAANRTSDPRSKVER